jgi:hypothetical protein
MFSKQLVSATLLVSIVFASGCGGGGGGSSPPPPADTILNGVAAAGAPIIGQVTVKDSLGATRSSLIEADGSYAVDVSGLTAPFRLRAEGTVGGRTYKLHSYADTADVTGTVNITPFTDLIIANAAGQIAASYFDANTVTALTPAEIDAQETALQAKLQQVFTALGVSAAIDLLNTTFSADHSGLDAALDIVRVSVDSVSNIATITNLIENTSITDNITLATDNTATLTVTNASALTAAVTDTQAIANIFTNWSAAFASGLPTGSALTTLQGYLASDFLLSDQTASQFLTDISTNPDMVGLMFSGVSVELTSATAANVTFNFGVNGNLFAESVETWFAIKESGTWKLRGDQSIADVGASYQCTNNTSYQSGTSCSFHVQVEDADFANNPTQGVAIVSATATVVDGTTGNDKAVVYLDTPTVQQGGEAGYLQIYNNGNYSGDYQPFGTGAGEIDPTALSTTFLAGDSVRIDLYTSALDKTIPASPVVVGSPVATYFRFMPFAPELDAANAPYPAATQATLTAATAYTLGNNLTVSWALAAGTRNDVIALLITDSNGAGADIFVDTFGSTATSKTINWSDMSSQAALLSQSDTQYNLELRVYVSDEVTGQNYLTQYFGTIPGPAAGGGGSTLTCTYESGWDDLASGGMGAPINPNSFADYETVIADCATAVPFAAADVDGSVFSNGTESTTFNALNTAAGTFADPGTGTFNDGLGTVINFEWYVETASCQGCTYSYLVVYSDNTIDPTNVPAGVWFRETSALTGLTGTPGVAGAVYSFKKYSEQSNYSNTDRATGADGEIWGDALTLQ